MPGEHDEEATARAEADAMGLGVLDAVDVGGTWTVVGDAAPATHEPAERRRPRRRLLWAGAGSAAAMVLLIAAAISHVLPGPRPAIAPSTPPAAVAPGATDQPGGAPTPSPATRATRMPGAVVPAAQPQTTGFTPAPVASPSGAPTPTPTATPAPTPTATIGPSPISISPSALPPPTPLPAG
jgi:cell division septation protein DedD